MTSTIASAQEEPFFLVGSERSGTTLLRLMLAHHRSVECAPEFEFLVEGMPAESGWPDLDEYYGWLSTNRIFAPHRLEVDRRLDYPGLMNSFLAQYGERTGKPIRGATCHKHFDRLLRIWPRARFIHLVRDGRDVARSCIGMGWAGNLWHAAERWVEAEELWASLLPRIEAKRRYELCYEALIENPERELAAVCAFLGTDYDPAMLDYTKNSSYERPDPGLIAQWKRKLRPEELALLEARIGPMLRAKGYEDSGVPAAKVGPWRRFTLGLDDRLERLRFRSNRYGVGHVLCSRIARSLGLKSWMRTIQIQENEVDNRHLR